MSGVMTENRLLELIAAYGADVSAFPEAEQPAARAMLKDKPALFADALRDAEALDLMLTDLPAVDTPASLRAALIDSAPKARPGPRASRWRLPVWLPAGAFASLAVGLFAGMSVAQPISSQDEQAEALVYAALGYDSYVFDAEEDITQ